MQLFVRTNGRILTIHVDAQDSIRKIKEEVEEREGIPFLEQRLTFASRNLPNHLRIEQCNISNATTLELSLSVAGGVQVNIKQMGKPKPFAFEMDLSDTVESLKSKIETEEGIPLQEVKLSFRGKPLGNDALLSTIKPLQVKGMATLLLTQKKTAETVQAEKNKAKTSVVPAEPAKLCNANCGFYGSAAKGGYCSSCFAKLDIVIEGAESKEKIDEVEAIPIIPEGEPKEIQTDVSHCWSCHRKVGLLGFRCKCEYTFCAEHRYSDKHECSFDYQERERVNLVKKLEKVEDRKGLCD